MAGALLGAIVGSFLATWVLRSGRGEGVVAGRSHCDHCDTRIIAADLLPVASFAMLGGRARCCGHPIDLLHPAAELLGALVIGVGLYFGGWHAALFGLLLLTLALFDARHFWLPDLLTATLALSGLALSPVPIEDKLIGMVAGYGALAAIGFGYRRLRGREGLGGGDPKLLGAIGAWMGFAPLPMVMVIASVIGLGWAIGLRQQGQAVDGTTRLPLGTLMALAAFPLWLWGSF